MDTLDENEVDIGEVQVGLCDNMIGTTSAIWESYDSYDSKDDTFTWESVEMKNESFDIPQQRDAPTKDCKGKGFLNCIRPVIVMDGTFLKNKYCGQLIVSVCLDGNNQIYPLAFGVVDRETDDSIQWFLEKLKGAIGEVSNLGFVTDRKTWFSKAYVEAVYPVGNQSYWKTSEDYVHMTATPPKVVKRPGRPKKKRIPSIGEAPKLH
ncbi:MuDRA-like transposase [Cucumis melo var. makuwa]|uniref:MuDRA-like transposase n=1 Tax=Cucumis melo var. makuwa TaxID=1194695 RepID=A0A5A7UT62_CUCMM|nr:MuDRA-like transposase [Cucumis melo var. makuwa]